MTPQVKFIRNASISTVSFSAILFIAAGTVDYREGWIYFLTTVVTTVMAFISGRKDPELLNERAHPGEGVKAWDKAILALSALISVATLVVAGLDSGRYGWTPEPSITVNLTGACLMLAGHSIFLMAKKENRFFSTVVRIQKERGHTVCDTGVYTIVRHPGYLGMMLSTAGIPFLLGSRWCAIPVVFAMILLCIRTVLEDKTLMNELTGYDVYARTTRFKLIPSIW